MIPDPLVVNPDHARQWLDLGLRVMLLHGWGLLLSGPAEFREINLTKFRTTNPLRKCAKDRLRYQISACSVPAAEQNQ